MTETYSLAINGLRSDQVPQTKTLVISDSNIQGRISSAPTASAFGAAWTAMRNGSQVLCKNPDGSQSWYTYDAERSTPANPVLKAV